MSEAAPAPLGPYLFTLTREEAGIVAARAGLRATLAGRMSRNHVAPLVAFVLLIVFIAILTLTGLLGRRLGEAALILAAIAFMASRMIAHWRLRGAQKTSLANAAALHEAGETRLEVVERALRFENALGSRLVAFADCQEAEEAGGMIYLWLRGGEPAFIPARAFASVHAAEDFLAFVRQKIRRKDA